VVTATVVGAEMAVEMAVATLSLQVVEVVTTADRVVADRPVRAVRDTGTRVILTRRALRVKGVRKARFLFSLQSTGRAAPAFQCRVQIALDIRRGRLNPSPYGPPLSLSGVPTAHACFWWVTLHWKWRAIVSGLSGPGRHTPSRPRLASHSLLQHFLG
jgi:hypothetical protein